MDINNSNFFCWWWAFLIRSLGRNESYFGNSQNKILCCLSMSPILCKKKDSYCF